MPDLISRKTVQALLDANASKLGEVARTRYQRELDTTGDIDTGKLNTLYDSVVRSSGGAIAAKQHKDGFNTHTR